MKFTSAAAAATLLASVAVMANPDQRVYSEPLQDELIESFQEPKNILFASSFGGSSHVTWVFTILDELSQRGHNITYVTTELQAKFAKPYPHFNTIVLEGDSKTMESAISSANPAGHIDLFEIIGNVFEYSNRNFKTEYPAMKNIMKSLNIDAALCDFGSAPGCFEAATVLKIPYVITEAFAMAEDSSAPYVNNNVLTMRDATTLRMSFTDRFIDMFVKPIKVMKRLIPASRKIDEMRRSVGCNITSMEIGPNDVHRNNLKLVNSLYGIEAARPMGPLVEMVGPIMPRKYDPLTPQLKDFLDAHERIIYIAFGQHASSTKEDHTKLLTAIMESIEAGTYDGFLWANRQGAKAFPGSVTTKSGQTYNVEQMFDGLYAHSQFIRWAPQTAVVMHPSVSVFVTHGGAGSFYEGLYAGKRLAVFPFFGDQFPHAHIVEQNGMGVHLDHELSQADISKKIEIIGRDADGVIQKNVNRYKALVQIHSRHGPIRGADLVEEVIFVNKEGLLPYRYEDSRQMSFMKAHNFDLFAVAITIVSVPVLIALFIFRKIIACIFSRNKNSIKQKTM